MPIAELRGYWLAAPLAEPLRNSVGTIATREALLIELVDDDGGSAWGETQRSGVEVWAAIEALAPLLLGRGEPDIAAIGDAATAAPGEVAMMAASAIDIALWDRRGRLEGRSVAAMLGEVRRTRIRAYASGPFLRRGDDPYRALLDDSAALVDAGFTALKPRIGIDPATDARALERLRSRVDAELAVDVNTGYRPDTAAELLRRVAPLGLRWVEEPLPPLAAADYAELIAGSPVPVAAGESLAREHDFARALDAGLAVLQPDLYLCGGFTGALRIAALAAERGVPVLPHVFGAAVNLAASLQLAAVVESVAGYPWFELDRNPNPLRTLLPEPEVAADGTIAIPDAPGLGLDLDRERLAPFVRRSWAISAPAAS